MGQQQLLIVLIVAIIVGIATFLAVNVLKMNAKVSNRDSVRQDVFTIAAEAQSWYIKPVVLKGGGNTFNGVDFDKIGFGYDSLISKTDVINGNGEYKMLVSDSIITLTAIPVHDKLNALTVKIKRASLTIESD